MADLLDKIKEAKEIKGDAAFETIVDYLHCENVNIQQMKCSCPWHKDNTPSFIWDKKVKALHCFSCNRTYSIVDMYTSIEGTYNKALQRLFKETDIAFDVIQHEEKQKERSDYFKNYRYPREETITDSVHGLDYLHKRGISDATIKAMDLRFDKYDNVAFQLRDEYGKLLGVKYRVSHPIKAGESKMFWQKDADTCPILYNMDKVDITKPLLITEGYFDCLAAIEAGYTNTVSIPGGAVDDNWINFNYDWLNEFEKIVLWFDNDKAGQDGLAKAINRLGEYRCYVATPTEEDENAVEEYYKKFNPNIIVRKTDANNILLAAGDLQIINIVNNAKEIPSKRLKKLMECDSVNVKDIPKIPTGIKALDKVIYGNLEGCFTIITAAAGCVDANTEFFTGTQWKKIADYQLGDKVAQWVPPGDLESTSVDWSNGKMELVYPENYIKKPCDKLYHFATKYGISQTLSDEHRIPYISPNNKFHECKIQDIITKQSGDEYGWNGRFITSFRYNGDGIELTDDEIRIMVAVIADGYYPRPNTNCCYVHIKKEEKKIRMRKLLNASSLKWSEYFNSNGYSTFHIFTPIHTKVFNEYWYNCSQHQLQVICDELPYWDGNINITNNGTQRIRINTTIKQSADFIQFAYSAIGYRASISIHDRRGRIRIINNKEYTTKSIDYVVHITDKTLIGLTANNDSCHTKTQIASVPTDGYKYCFTVPSSYLILRKDNNIFITGNSGKSSFANIINVLSPIDRGEKVFIFSGELNNSQLLDWILTPLAGYNHIIEWTDQSCGAKAYYPAKESESAMKKFYKDSIILYDDADGLNTSGDTLLQEMENAYKRYGTKIFLIDNLMCLSFDEQGVDSVWAAQKKFIVKLLAFTNKYKVNVNLILHPRKPSKDSGESVYELAGSSDIANMAHRVLWLSRLKEDPEGFDLQVRIVKDRPTGRTGEVIKLNYDSKTRRIYGDNDERFYQYSWESTFHSNYSDAIKKNLICNLPIEEKVIECPF